MLIDFHQAVIAEVIDETGYAFSLLKDFNDGVIGKQRVGSASDSEVMGDIGFGLTAVQTGEVIFEIDALIKGFHGIEVDGFKEIGLSGEDKIERSLRIDFKVGEQSKFFEGFGGQQLCFIDDEESGFVKVMGVFFDEVSKSQIA